MKHLQRALDGRNQIVKYIVVLLVGLIGGQLLGSIPLGIVVIVATIMKGDEFVAPENVMDFAAYGINPSVGLILIVIPFITTMLISMAMIKSFHQRSLNDVINGRKSIRWKRVLTGAIIYGLVMLISIGADIVANPDNFIFQFNPLTFVPLFIVTFLFIPLQSATEEFLFRGYLAQGVAGITRNRVLVILIPSLFFALLHSTNPEIKEHGFLVMMPHYLFVGITLAIISVLDDGIELAIGVHAINNCLSSVFITSKESALQTPALFVEKEVNPNADLLFLVFTSLIMLVIFQIIYRWDFSILLKKIEPLPNEEGKVDEEFITIEN